MGKTKIQWTMHTWNTVAGCSHCSPGCRSCYAERFSYRLANIAIKKYDFPDFNHGIGKYFHVINMHKKRFIGNVKCDDEALELPIRWKKPSLVFVNSMSDLFHEDVPQEFIHKVFGVMKHCERHIFQVLTKRPQNIPKSIEWPDNVWCGLTVCTQKEAEEKIRIHLKVNAQTHFLSVEPMLERIDLSGYILDTGDGYPFPSLPESGRTKFIDWYDQIICGGESGRTDRALEPDWARSLRDQCVEAKVPFFFKQWGNYCYPEQMPDETYRWVDSVENLATGAYNNCYKVGKKRAGNLLDGKKWNQYPQAFYDWKEKYHGKT